MASIDRFSTAADGATGAHAEDATNREMIAARIQLDALICRVRRMLADNGTGIPDGLRTPCEQAIRDADRALGTTDLAALRDALARLESTSHAASDALYHRAKR